MSGVLILTISGRDRAGLVEKLADLIAEHGGNWEHCRMAHLAGRFVGLLEVTVTGNQQQDLESALRGISDLDVMIAPGLVPSDMEPMRQFDLEVVGSDHPGIVRDVFKALAQVSVNVEELSTRAYSAPDSGCILFEAKARLASSSKVNREKIRNHLEEIGLDVLVDIRLLD
jgi:glycine cleavage system regulatory protein